MGAQHAHTKLLNAAARDALRPLGLVQRGRSRTWLDDRGWWLGLVEFQPSSWARGSYLNAGVNWLWSVKAHLSFDYGGRVVPADGDQFVRYQSDDQFEPLARRLAFSAADHVARQRSFFETVESTASVLQTIPATNLLGSLDAGVALGLAGDAEASRAMLDRYTSWYESDRSLHARGGLNLERYTRAQLLADLVDDRSRFAGRIHDDVAATRARLKLGDADLPF